MAPSSRDREPGADGAGKSARPRADVSIRSGAMGGAAPGRGRYVTVTASGETIGEAMEKAVRYAAPPGWTADVVATRRRRVRLGILGYRVWDFRLRITRIHGYTVERL